MSRREGSSSRSGKKIPYGRPADEAPCSASECFLRSKSTCNLFDFRARTGYVSDSFFFMGSDNHNRRTGLRTVRFGYSPRTIVLDKFIFCQLLFYTNSSRCGREPVQKQRPQHVRFWASPGTDRLDGDEQLRVKLTAFDAVHGAKMFPWKIYVMLSTPGDFNAAERTEYSLTAG